MSVRIRPVSDLHLSKQSLDERTKEAVFNENEDADIFICAGDITSVKNYNLYYKFLKDVSQCYEKVILVKGNHELYGLEFETGISYLKEISGKLGNVYLLEREAIRHKNVKFIGATLWSDFNNRSSICIEKAKRILNDLKQIRRNGKVLSYQEYLSFHYRDLKFLNDKLQEEAESENNNYIVVLTHHAPSWQSGDPRFVGSALSGAFMSDCESLVSDSPVDLWVHGHIHHHADYRLSGTRVLCNPHGRINEETFFKKDMVIEYV